jgi:hypothetical protein
MKNLLALLERFSKNLNKDVLVKEQIVGVIKERTRVTLSPENLHLKDGVLEINTSSVGKSEINLKEESLKSELRETYKINISRVLYK